MQQKNSVRHNAVSSHCTNKTWDDRPSAGQCVSDTWSCATLSATANIHVIVIMAITYDFACMLEALRKYLSAAY